MVSERNVREKKQNFSSVLKIIKSHLYLHNIGNNVTMLSFILILIVFEHKIKNVLFVIYN